MKQVILDYLKKNSIPHTVIHHAPIFTMEHTKTINGLDIKEGAKSLLLKANETYILFVIPGDVRLDSKKIKKMFYIKDLRFATPEEVEKNMKCKIGSCYPFGNLVNIPMFVDITFQENKSISFTPGVHSTSIKIPWKNYFELVKPNLLDIVENKSIEVTHYQFGRERNPIDTRTVPSLFF